MTLTICAVLAVLAIAAVAIGFASDDTMRAAGVRRGQGRDA